MVKYKDVIDLKSGNAWNVDPAGAPPDGAVPPRTDPPDSDRT